MSVRLRVLTGAALRRLSVHVEAAAHAAQRRPSPERALRSSLVEGLDMHTFLRSLRVRESPRFFFDRAEASEVVRSLGCSLPGWRKRLIADADRISQGIVRLLGADAVDLTSFTKGARREGLPWHEDVLSHYRWNARTFHKRIEIPYDRADIKVPWELSRCQHLPTLGVAYVATGDERYAREIVAQIDNWIAANPPGRGVNWACAMEVAIRAVNWLWAYHLVVPAQSLSDSFLARFIVSLIDHGRHIRRNIERYDGITSNHTLADYTGLLYLGLLFPELVDASDWVDVGTAGVVECMEFQVAGDGVDFENSIAYHRLVLEMFLGCYVLCARNDCPLPDPYRHSLERMLEFVHHYTRPDGLAPLVGDTDDGRLQILSQYFAWHPQDHCYLLRIGAAMFGRPDFAEVAEGAPGALEEAMWLLGPCAGEGTVQRLGARLPRASCAFPISGRYVMRHGDHYALILADEVGTAGLGNHKHNDIFSFELTVDGVPIFVDPGSFQYTSDLASREAFRSTCAHNTLMVDGVEQNEPIGPFGMRADARVSVATWFNGSTHDVFEASHTGYARLSDAVIHRRRIALMRDPFTFVVLDSIVCRLEHLVESFLHAAPGAQVRKLAQQNVDARLEELVARVRQTMRTGEVLDVRPEAGRVVTIGDVDLIVLPVNWSSLANEDGWISPRYGQRVPAPVLRLSGRIRASSPAVGFLVLRPEEVGVPSS
jgi:hypothetical protein